MNKSNPIKDFFWLPIVLVKGLWFILSLMFLALIHTDACRECEHMMYRNPRKVSYSTRRGMELCHIGQALFCCVFCLLATLCIINLV